MSYALNPVELECIALRQFTAFCFYEKINWFHLCRLSLFMYFLALIDKGIQAIFPDI